MIDTPPSTQPVKSLPSCQSLVDSCVMLQHLWSLLWEPRRGGISVSFDDDVTTGCEVRSLCELGYTMAISVPAEMSAAATLVQFWDSNTNPAVWLTVFLAVIICLNFCGVRMYGEVWFLTKSIPFYYD